MADAIGMIEVEGVAGIVVGADAACKAGGVQLLGWESIGGFTTVFFRGPLGDVTRALDAGERAAKSVVEHVVAASLDRPRPECALFVDVPVPDGEVADTALGLVETRGYGAHVEVDDAMVKAASVQVARVLTVHNRVVCTLVTGAVGDVEQAVARARQLLSPSEWFLGSAVIPQPVPEVLRAFTRFGAAGGAS